MLNFSTIHYNICNFFQYYTIYFWKKKEMKNNYRIILLERYYMRGGIIIETKIKKGFLTYDRVFKSVFME